MDPANFAALFGAEIADRELFVAEGEYLAAQLQAVRAAFSDLRADEGFVSLLQAEGLRTVPAVLELAESPPEMPARIEGRFPARCVYPVCPEALALLQRAVCAAATYRIVGRMKPARQIKVAEFMNRQRDRSQLMAEALLFATPQSQLRWSRRSTSPGDGSRKSLARLERQLAELQRQSELVQRHYAWDHLCLGPIGRYLESLLGNARVANWLERRHPECRNLFSHTAALAGSKDRAPSLTAM